MISTINCWRDLGVFNLEISRNSHRWCNFVALRTSLEDEVCVLKTCTAASAGHYEVHGTEAQQLSGQLRPQQQLLESLMFLESYFLYVSNFQR